MKLYYALKKEFTILFRNKHALGALFLMPVLFILVMSLALKDVYKEYTDAKITYIIVDQDQSKQSKELIKRLDKYPNLTSAMYHDLDSAKQSTLQGNYAFTLLIHRYFGKNLYKINAQNLIDIYTPATTKMPRKLFFQSKIAQILMEMKIKKIVNALTLYNDDVNITTPADMIHVHALSESGKPVKMPTATQQNVPAWIVFSMFFVIIPISTLFITERQDGTLTRLITINTPKSILFASKIIPYIIINQLQLLTMLFVGAVLVPLLGGDRLDLSIHYPALFVISLAISFAAICFAILLSTFMKNIEQASTLGALSCVIMGAFGGIMVPKIVMPPVMQTLSQLSPMAWGMEGMLDIFVKKLGTADILFETAILILFGIISLIMAYGKRLWT